MVHPTEISTHQIKLNHYHSHRIYRAVENMLHFQHIWGHLTFEQQTLLLSGHWWHSLTSTEHQQLKKKLHFMHITVVAR